MSLRLSSLPAWALLLAAAGFGCQDAEGAAPVAATGGSSGAGGGGAAGTSGGGSGGVSGTVSVGGGGEVSGNAGAPVVGGAGGAAGGSAGGVGGGGAGALGCAASAHPVCVDFESGKLDAGWSLGSNNSAGTSAKVESGQAAHGMYALHLTGFHMGTSTLIHTTQLGDIKDVMWGRYYLYMDPGAPTGHGGMVRAFDVAKDWYELGFEYNSFLGNWHPATPNAGGWIERAMRTHDTITGKSWVCVEFQFDGAKPEVAQIWYDGKQVSYYSVISYCEKGNGPGSGCEVTLTQANQFASFDIGVEFYHGTSLAPDMWSGDGPPTITDAFIDDLALDTERIGCL